MSKTAFDAKRTTAFAFAPDALTVVGVDTEKDYFPELYDPRVTEEDAEEFEALVDSIVAYGVIEPVLVWKDEKGFPVVVAGRRRTLAARDANAKLISMGCAPSVAVPAVRAKASSRTELLELMITENELRKDDGPMQKASKLRRLQDAGKNDEECALTFGVSKQTIRNWKKLWDLSPRVRAAVESGEIKPTAAGKLAKLTYDEQDEKLDRLLDGDGKATSTAAAAEAAGRHAAPPKRFLLKLVDYGGEHGVPRDFLEGIRYAMGELDPKSQDGLTDLIRKVSGAA